MLAEPGGATGGAFEGGAEAGIVVCTFSWAGGGGTNGTFSGGIVESGMGFGEDGDAGETDATGPGIGGAGRVVVVLPDPGRTTASELWMLGLEFLKSAKYL